ncbi:MAG: HpcH/HpaI aldolase/citrate lyase family protein [Sulfurifustaceae bacterium]
MPTRLRRSELSTPGSNEKMMAKAAASAADLVFLDLEDSVAPKEKAAARAKIVNALKTLDWGKKTRAVRINNLETEYAYRDIIDVVEQAGEYLDLLIVPKVKTAKDVWWVDVLLTQIETRLGMKKRIGIEVLIEEVEAMINAEEIARASPRLEALIFGPGDYSASQGVDTKNIGDGSDAYPGDIWHYARNKVIIAARAAGIDMVDGPYAAFKNPEGYRRECIRARTLGAVGKWAIHPSQIEIANEAFSPTREQVERARKLAAAYAEAEAAGLGAVNVDGTMVDAASIRILQNTLKKADLMGL